MTQLSVYLAELRGAEYHENRTQIASGQGRPQGRSNADLGFEGSLELQQINIDFLSKDTEAHNVQKMGHLVQVVFQGGEGIVQQEL